MIELIPPPTFRRRRGDLAIGGVAVGSFLGETRSAQARRFCGFDLFLVLGGRRHFHMDILRHLKRISIWQWYWVGVRYGDNMAIGQPRAYTRRLHGPAL